MPNEEESCLHHNSPLPGQVAERTGDQRWKEGVHEHSLGTTSEHRGDNKTLGGEEGCMYFNKTLWSHCSEMSGCPSAEPGGFTDEGGQERCRSCVLGNARALPCSRSGLRMLHEITSPCCCPESKERGPFSASFQLALRNVKTANQFDYTEILESANYLVKWCV